MAKKTTTKKAADTKMSIASTDAELVKLVDFGVQRNREKLAAEKDLEIVKPEIRLAAQKLAAASNEITVTLEGTIGTVTVSFKGPCVKARELSKDQKVNLYKDAKPALPVALYEALFEEKTVTTPRADFMEKFQALPEPQRRALLEFVEIAASTPQVTFK
jgi:hypothetical protein